MVRIFGRTLRWPWFKESAQALEAGTAKVWGAKKGVSVYKLGNVKSYYDAYLNQDLIRGPVDDLVESAVGQGCFTTVETVSPIRQTNRAKNFIDNFHKHFNTDSLLPNITRHLLIAGFCPVETRLVAGPVEKNAVKVIHPLTLDPQHPIESRHGEVLRIHQKVGKDVQTIEGENLAWFVYNQLGNDPRGVSFVRSLIKLLNTIEKTTDKVDKILDRYIGPIPVIKTRRSTKATKTAFKEREPDEAIILGELSAEEVKSNPIDFIQIDPRVPYWAYLEYLDRRIYAAGRANNLWYSKDATVASAETLDDIVQRHVRAIQRDVKRSVERFWHARLVEINNLPEIPKLNFGLEPTGVEDIQPAEIITTGIEVGYIDRPLYFKILSKVLGFEVKDEEEEVPGSAQPSEEEPEERALPSKPQVSPIKLSSLDKELES